jgi:arginase family enzyme
LIDPAAYIQVGIRGSTSSDHDYADARALGARIITADEAQARGVQAVLAEVQEQMGRRKVYVSLDIDSADPAYAPGTGTPEVGGFSSRELLQYVRGLRNLQLVGFDLVEVSPPYDHGDITAVLAANLAFEFLSLLALQRKKN